MAEELPKGLLENLSPGEEVQHVIGTALAVNPQYIVLTDRRVIRFHDELWGRYRLADIPYPKLRAVKATRGSIAFGSLEFTGEDDAKIWVDKAPKDGLAPFMDALEEIINRFAVEPVSVKRSRGVLGEMTWELTKEPEVLTRTKPADEPREGKRKTRQDDPLTVLKMRFANGEIDEDEYLRRKRVLEG